MTTLHTLEPLYYTIHYTLYTILLYTLDYTCTLHKLTHIGYTCTLYLYTSLVYTLLTLYTRFKRVLLYTIVRGLYSVYSKYSEHTLAHGGVLA